MAYACESRSWAATVLAAVVLGAGCAAEVMPGDDSPESVAAGEVDSIEEGLYQGTDDPYVTVPNHGLVYCVASPGTNPGLVDQMRYILNSSWARAIDMRILQAPPGDNTAVCNAADLKAPQAAKISFSGTADRASTKGRNVTLLTTDTSLTKATFRRDVIHEFGHLLGFAHEQERPNNWDANGNAIFCPITDRGRKTVPGRYLTAEFDTASIMSYCSGATTLSAGDIEGARVVYGRNPAAHGFMIKSDKNPGLALNAWGGAKEGTVLRLHEGCRADNPDCTWTYEDGMIRSDSFPTLAINAWGGAGEGTVLKLTRLCTRDNPDCTWTYSRGQFKSDRSEFLVIAPEGGQAVHGATLALTTGCSGNNDNCSWTLPNVMLTHDAVPEKSLNAFGGARNGSKVSIHDDCTMTNTDCTWTFSHGMILSDTNQTLAVNAWGGAAPGRNVLLSNACNTGNLDCLWTWSRGHIRSARDRNLSIFSSTYFNGDQLTLLASCPQGSPDCTYSGMWARP